MKVFKMLTLKATAYSSCRAGKGLDIEALVSNACHLFAFNHVTIFALSVIG
jgi:hypothetical protein